MLVYVQNIELSDVLRFKKRVSGRFRTVPIIFDHIDDS